MLLEQLGLQAEEGEREAARVTDEAVVSYQPLVAYFIGVDTDQVRAALEENRIIQDDPERETTIYFGAIEDDERALDRAIAVSDNRERGVVAVQATNYDREQFEPVSTRFGGL